MAKVIRRLSVVMLTVIICLMAMIAPVTTKQVYAETSGSNFDNTNVLDDLMSSAEFDILSYPFYESSKPKMQVINVVEYCYSYVVNKRANYGLYLYVYNPNGLKISESSISNKVTMAVSYDSEGNPNDYEKFELKFCSKVTEPNYYGLFYKFKVIDHKSKDGKTIVERVNSLERRYDISEIELLNSESNTADAFAINGTYRFTGYAKGYGPDERAESSLDCKVDYLETVELDVKHTFYRTKTSSKGAGHQNQLDTVYFSVPKRFFDTYGYLQKIKAEWYEYKTKPIVVTSLDEFYSAAISYVGKRITPYDEDIGYCLFLNKWYGSSSSTINRFDWAWNPNHLTDQEVSWNNIDYTLYYLFKTNSIKEYDPYADIEEQGGVSSNKLYNYILSYNKSYEHGRLPIKDGTISADLFASDIDEERKTDTDFGKIQQGYSYYDFDANLDIQQMESWSGSNPSFWQNSNNFGFWNALFGNIPKEENIALSPIHILEKSDLAGDDNEVAQRLYMQSSDVSELRETYNEAIKVDSVDDEEKVVVLFRFATSDYHSEALEIIRPSTTWHGFDGKSWDNQAYIAEQSVFLDFDIIQLTFNKDGIYHVIPVVSSPIDIVNGITPPVELPDDGTMWKIIFAILALLLLCIILAPVLPLIFQAIIWIICLPFKLIAKLLKPLFKKKE